MKINYSFGSGLGNSGMSEISYTVEDNKLIVKITIGLGGTIEKTFELDAETLAQISGVVNEANEYYKTPEGKEMPFVYDGYASAKGTTDSGEEFEFNNNEKGIIIVDKIEKIVKAKNPALEEEIEKTYVELEKRAQEYRNELTNSFMPKIDDSKKEEEVLFEFGGFSGLDMLETIYTINGNKLTVIMSKLNNTSKTVVDLDEETLREIKGVIDEVGRYAKENANKEKTTVYDYSSYIKGKNSNGEEINLENDVEAMKLVYRIYEIVKQKNPTFEDELNKANAELNRNDRAQSAEDSLIARIKGIKAEIDKEKDQIAQQPEPSLIDLHPELYDENGALKPESVKLIDMLINTYKPEKVGNNATLETRVRI